MITAAREPQIPAMLYSKRDTAAALAISERTLDRLSAAGLIVPLKLGNGRRIVRFTAVAIQEFIENNSTAEA
jgi:hypothetical protein